MPTNNDLLALLLTDPSIRASVERRLWPNVKKTRGCWNWTASLCHGYGQIAIVRCRPVRVHRVVWTLLQGEVPPPGLMVLHSCDNPACCRPSHLRLGDAGDNSRDMVSRGRAHLQRHPEQAMRGEKSPVAKLTDKAVRKIRALSAKGVGQHPIARRFAVSRSLIQAVVQRRVWTHIYLAADDARLTTGRPVWQRTSIAAAFSRADARPGAPSMPSSTITAPCSLHGIGSCVLCFKPGGRCDFGACLKTATHKVERTADGRLVETRPTCAAHARRLSNMDGSTVVRA